jgi:membrane-associated phospholipid phosphatase
MSRHPTTVSQVRDQLAGREATGYVAAGLFFAAVVQLAALAVMWRVFVGSVRGQLLDAASLAGHRIGASYLEGLVDTVLNAMTVVSLAVAIIAIGFIALARGRVVLAAVATLLVIGANVTTQVLKYVIDRPELGVDVARAAAGNSLPSGHTTVAASVAVALVLVLPPALRGLAGVLGAGYTALAGAATLSAGWHRPSDAVAALLVVGVWAAAAGLVLMAAHRTEGGRAGVGTGPGQPPRGQRLAVVTLVLAGLGMLAIAAAAMAVTYQELATPAELLGRGRLLAAYAGGAAGVAGAAGLVMAFVVVIAPHVVPDRAS